MNWKVRFENPVFLTQLFLSFLMPILTYFGLTAKDLTTWVSFFDVIVKSFQNPYVVGSIIVSLWHAVNNPTTKGLGDKQ